MSFTSYNVLLQAQRVRQRERNPESPQIYNAVHPMAVNGFSREDGTRDRNTDFRYRKDQQHAPDPVQQTLKTLNNTQDRKSVV